VWLTGPSADWGCFSVSVAHTERANTTAGVPVRKVFVSYARQNRADIDQLVEHLGVLGCDTWVDRSLHGGQDWWKEILGRIADCDTFIAIISREALSSTACRREFDWAESLGKPVLPVAVQPPPRALPARFVKRQIIDYSSPADRDRAALTLAGGLATLPSAPPLPDPLPQHPAAPLSYLTDLIDLVSQQDALDHDQQRHILNQLEPALRSVDPEERRGGRDILELLSSRDDIYRDVDLTITRLKDLAEASPPLRAPDQRSAQAGPPTGGGQLAAATTPEGEFRGQRTGVDERPDTQQSGPTATDEDPPTEAADIVNAPAATGPPPEGPVARSPRAEREQVDAVSAASQASNAPVQDKQDQSSANTAMPPGSASGIDVDPTSPTGAAAAEQTTKQATAPLDRKEAEAKSAPHQPSAASEDPGLAVAATPSSPDTASEPDRSATPKSGSPASTEDRRALSVRPTDSTRTPAGVRRLQKLNRRTKIVLGAVVVSIVVTVAVVAIVMVRRASQNAADARLLEVVPTGFDSSNCTPNNSNDWGAVSGLYCRMNGLPGVPTEVRFWLFGDDGALAHGFSGISGFHGAGPCPGGVVSWANGQVGCGYDGGIVWTNQSGMLVGDADGPNLYNWFVQNIRK
jgi:TIR domain